MKFLAGLTLVLSLTVSAHGRGSETTFDHSPWAIPYGHDSNPIREELYPVDGLTNNGEMDHFTDTIPNRRSFGHRGHSGSENTHDMFSSSERNLDRLGSSRKTHLGDDESHMSHLHSHHATGDSRAVSTRLGDYEHLPGLGVRDRLAQRLPKRVKSYVGQIDANRNFFHRRHSQRRNHESRKISQEGKEDEEMRQEAMRRVIAKAEEALDIAEGYGIKAEEAIREGLKEISGGSSKSPEHEEAQPQPRMQRNTVYHDPHLNPLTRHVNKIDSSDIKRIADKITQAAMRDPLFRSAWNTKNRDYVKNNKLSDRAASKNQYQHNSARATEAAIGKYDEVRGAENISSRNRVSDRNKLNRLKAVVKRIIPELGARYDDPWVQEYIDKYIESLLTVAEPYCKAKMTGNTKVSDEDIKRYREFLQNANFWVKQ